MSRGKLCNPVAGFSLLEVILATSIIAASSMVLLRLISTGQEHQQRGERRAIGQMICQSLIDEMSIRPELQVSVDQQRVTEFPDWTYTIDAEPTEFQGLVRIRIRAAETPVDLERTPDDLRYDFELVRWLRSERNVNFDQGELEESF
jgi:Tfp pilus assembly protein PilV